MDVTYAEWPGVASAGAHAHPLVAGRLPSGGELSSRPPWEALPSARPTTDSCEVGPPAAVASW